jgi:hypothetical protein
VTSDKLVFDRLLKTHLISLKKLLTTVSPIRKINIPMLGICHANIGGLVFTLFQECPSHENPERKLIVREFLP